MPRRSVVTATPRDLDTPQADPPPHLNVNVSSRSRIKRRLRMIAQCPPFGFLAHAAALPVIRRRLGGGKASLHLGENEIWDRKVNCAEYPKDDGHNDCAPKQRPAPAQRSSRPHDTGSGQPQRELPGRAGVAGNKVLDMLWNGDAFDVGTGLNFEGDIFRNVLRPML